MSREQQDVQLFADGNLQHKPKLDLSNWRVNLRINRAIKKINRSTALANMFLHPPQGNKLGGVTYCLYGTVAYLGFHRRGTKMDPQICAIWCIFGDQCNRKCTIQCL